MTGKLNMKRAALILLGALFELAPAAAFASVFGTVKAIVHDPQHRPVQGAQVVVQSRTPAFKQTGVTNEDGIATVLNVPVGEYDIKIATSGFADAQQSVMVTSDNVQELHFALTVAQHQETVQVSGEPEMVDPASSTPEAV